MLNGNTIVRHHLLEIIFWPMPDGSMKTIINSRERLRELGIYDDYKMVIEIPVREHATLHGNFQTEEKKKQISEALKGRPSPNKGHVASAELRALLSKIRKGQRAWNKGVPATEEHKRHISEGMKGKQNLLGYHHTDETKRKISAIHKGKPKSEEQKRKMSESAKKRWAERHALAKTQL